MTVLKKLLPGSAFLFLVSLGISGCLKSTLPQTPSANTYVNVMHMAPWSVPVQIYLNNSASSSNFPALAYSTLYSPLAAGSYDVKFKKANSDSLVAAIPAANYDSAKYYTLLTYNQSANEVKAARIEDIFNNTTAGKIHFRFWHLGPDAPDVDVYIDTDKVGSNRHYTDNLSTLAYNSFLDYDPGYYKIYVKAAGTDSVIAQTSNGFDYVQGGYYTFFLNGSNSGTGQGLRVNVLRAAQ